MGEFRYSIPPNHNGNVKVCSAGPMVRKLLNPSWGKFDLRSHRLEKQEQMVCSRPIGLSNPEDYREKFALEDSNVVLGLA